MKKLTDNLSTLNVTLNYNKDLLTPAEAAKLLHVAPTTIRLWAQKGKLASIVTPGGHRRFNLDDVKSLMKTSIAPAKKQLSILIVDDDKDLGDMLLQLLNHYLPDANLMLADNGFKAGDLLHTFTPNIVLLDLMMPEIDGFSICQRIKSIPDTEHITVIAMTGNHSDENIQRILSLGALTCIAKPIDFKSLTAIINSVKY